MNFRNLMFGVDMPVRLDNGRYAPAVNLDNAATTPPFKAVVREIERQLLCYGSIGRGKGQKSAHSTEVYVRGRGIVKAFAGADSGAYTIFYTNNTTDGMNKLASALIESPEDLVLTTRMEHHANDLPWRERCKTVYAEVDALGRLLIEDVERLLNEHGGAIKYVSVTAASNVTGYVNDVHAIARLAHRHGALLVVDGAQIVAHRAFSMLGQNSEEDVDFFVFSAHKMYSPFGGGAVVGRKDVLDRHIPAFYGGGMVEAVCDEAVEFLPAPDRYEAGSPNYPGVVGMLKAMEMLQSVGFEYIRQHEQALLSRLLGGLARLPGVTLYGDSGYIADRVGIAVFNVRGTDPEAVADFLAGKHGVAVRHAAFCAHPYVRRLMHEAEDEAGCRPPRGMVRASFGIYSSQADVDCLLAAVRELACCGHSRSFAAGANGAALLGGKPRDRG